jgi:hypothetical protein
LLFSCQKERYYTNYGVILGVDPSACACCGGLDFHFINQGDNIQNLDKPGDTTRRLVDNPQILHLNNPKYPIYLKLNWIPGSECGGSGFVIKITSFTKL